MDTNPDIRWQLVQQLLNGLGYTDVRLESSDERVISCLFSLVSQLQGHVHAKAHLEDRLDASEAETDAQRTKAARIQLAFDASDRANKALTMRVELSIIGHSGISNPQSLESDLKRAQAQATTAREEALKAGSNLQHAMAQFQHKSKRKETEFKALQDRLQRVATEQQHGVKLGMRVLNPSAKRVLAAPSKSSGVGDAASKEREMHTLVVSMLEEREKEMLAEVHAVKACLWGVYMRLKGFIAGGVEAACSGDAFEEARFHLPYIHVRPQIQEQFDAVLAVIEARVSDLVLQIGAQPPLDPEMEREATDRITQVQREMDEYKEIIDRQRHLLDMALETQPQPQEPPSLHELDSLSMEIEEQRAANAERALQLDAERRKFTEAAIRLGRERVALEQEREQFEEAKRAAVTRDLLTQMPDTPLFMKAALPPRVAAAAGPKTPTPVRGSTRARNASAANVGAAQQRIRTPTDSLRKNGALPAGMQRSASFPGNLGGAGENLIIAESDTFAGTPEGFKGDSVSSAGGTPLRGNGNGSRGTGSGSEVMRVRKEATSKTHDPPIKQRNGSGGMVGAVEEEEEEDSSLDVEAFSKYLAQVVSEVEGAVENDPFAVETPAAAMGLKSALKKTPPGKGSAGKRAVFKDV
ncbi:hypothetical protein BC830DRAFT_1173255 [Chytriomyces sp. MP71]|nr:hypothetical protein BC830DRAFT_1173255 [Chytriomyces sp. MP71]